MYLYAYLVLDSFIRVYINSFFKDPLLYLCLQLKKGIYTFGVIPYSILVSYLLPPVCSSFSLMLLKLTDGMIYKKQNKTRN